jgi:hypothetical protein
MNHQPSIEQISQYNDRIFNSLIWKKYNHLIFVYTPPKVGSTSLVSSLRLSASHKFIVLHVHDETMLNILTSYNNPYNVSIMDIIYFNASHGKKVFVIDIYRNPIERKMSVFFENISYFHFNNKDENINSYDLNRIIHRFNCLFMHIGNEDYFKEKYGNPEIPSFDFSKKYLKYENSIHENVTFIKLRLQDFTEWGAILSNLLKSDIIMIEDNKGENKQTGELYYRFKKEYNIPANFLECIKNDTNFLRYQSEEERNLYFDKWTNNQTLETFLSAFSKEEYFFYMKISKENQWQNNIQRDHYLDFGCVCFHCNMKRREVKQKIRNCQDTNILVYHEQVINDKKIKVQNKFMRSLQIQLNNIKNRAPILIPTKSIIHKVHNVSHKAK